LREPYDPFFDVDWSVALRGSYTKATSGERRAALNASDRSSPGRSDVRSIDSSWIMALAATIGSCSTT